MDDTLVNHVPQGVKVQKEVVLVTVRFLPVVCLSADYLGTRMDVKASLITTHVKPQEDLYRDQNKRVCWFSTKATRRMCAFSYVRVNHTVACCVRRQRARKFIPISVTLFGQVITFAQKCGVNVEIPM